MKALPQNKQEMTTFKAWLNQEQKRFQEDQEEVWPVMGATNRQREMKSYWRTHRPTMYKILLAENLLNQLAHVLECKMWEQEQKNQDSGIPWPDSRNLAQQEWLLMEPEEEM